MIRLTDTPRTASAITRRCRQLFFAGLASLLAQGAMATPLPDPPWESGSGGGSWGGTWNSTISCTLVEDGTATNVVGPTSVAQTATVNCTITYDDETTQSGICQLDISYIREEGLTTRGVTQCAPDNDPMNPTSTLTNVAFCGNASRGLVVSGTLDCNPNGNNPLPVICGGNAPCVANLDGITSVPNGQCGTVFPATDDLDEGQVLDVSVTTTGSSCDGEVILEHTKIFTRFCNSGSFNQGVVSSCLFGTGQGQQVASITGTTSVFLPVEVEVSPQKINVDCTPPDNGDVRFTVFGNENVDVEQIDLTSLELEVLPGVPQDDCNAPEDLNADGRLDLKCKVPSCPDLGPALKNKRSPADGTVSIEVRGSLNSGTAIRGEDTVGTTPTP